MASLQALTRGRLIKLLEETIALYGDQRFSIEQLTQKALPQAREICANDLDSAICGWMKPIAKRLMTRDPPHTNAPVLLAGLVLPYRIAVPTIYGEDMQEDGEDEDRFIWTPLHLCTIAEGRRNLQMRENLIAHSQVEYDRIKAVVDEAWALAGSEDAIIGRVLGR